MDLCIVYPAQAHSAYLIAAQAFAKLSKLSKQAAGATTRLLTDEQDCADAQRDSVTVLIGNDAVNSVFAERIGALAL